MSQRKKLILGVAGFTLLLVGAALAYNALSRQVQPEINAGQTQPGQAQAAPGFTVTDAEGSPVRLADFRGKPVVLNFWASWCPPCRQEMPDFDKAHSELGDEVVFMMVNLRESVETGIGFAEGLGYGFPVYFDARGDAAAAYGVTGIPATFFIDREGNIVSKASGMISEAALLRGIEGIR